MRRKYKKMFSCDRRPLHFSAQRTGAWLYPSRKWHEKSCTNHKLPKLNTTFTRLLHCFHDGYMTKYQFFDWAWRSLEFPFLLSGTYAKFWYSALFRLQILFPEFSSLRHISVFLTRMAYIILEFDMTVPLDGSVNVSRSSEHAVNFLWGLTRERRWSYLAIKHPTLCQKGSYTNLSGNVRSVSTCYCHWVA